MASTAISLEKVPPSQEEANVLHQTFLRDREDLAASAFYTAGAGAAAGLPNPPSKNEGIVPLAATMQSATLHMHPQQANVHLNVFGGVLLRHCYELGWITAAMFANRPVQFLSLDALSFHHPVPIGAILSMTSWVTYTSEPGDGDRIVAAVNVLAEIVDIETDKRKKSNTFHFSFDIGSTATKVSPLTYADSIEWLESRRRVQLGEQLRKSYRA